MQVVCIPILMKDYYFFAKYFRFMSSDIFDALEAAYLGGKEWAFVPELDFIQMTHQLILKNGIESN